MPLLKVFRIGEPCNVPCQLLVVASVDYCFASFDHHLILFLSDSFLLFSLWIDLVSLLKCGHRRLVELDDVLRSLANVYHSCFGILEL